MVSHKVLCWDCGAEIEDPFLSECPKCKGLLTIKLDLEKVKEKRPEDLRNRPMGVWRYSDFLPVDPGHKVSIQEGGTPLYKTDALAEIEIGRASCRERV